MCDQTEVSYLPDDVVWVKLGSLWWPGQVYAEDEATSAILNQMKKPPIAIVKFFQEEAYEYVKELSNIYHYNCMRKIEFIKKGLEIYRSNKRKMPSNMKLFPEDVIKAEVLTGGNPEILNEDVFLPEEKHDYKELFSLNKTPAKKARFSEPKKKESPHVPLQVTPRAITHPRFIKSSLGIDVDYEARVLEQPLVCEEFPVDESPAPLVTYKCHVCGYVTKRVDVLILHNKSHINNITKSQGRKMKSKNDKNKSKISNRGDVKSPNELKYKSAEKVSLGPKDKLKDDLVVMSTKKSAILTDNTVTSEQTKSQKDSSDDNLPDELIEDWMEFENFEQEETCKKVLGHDTADNSDIEQKQKGVSSLTHDTRSQRMIHKNVGKSVDSYESNVNDQTTGNSSVEAEANFDMEKTEPNEKLENKMKLENSKGTGDTKDKLENKMSCFDFDDSEDNEIDNSIIFGRKVPTIISKQNVKCDTKKIKLNETAHVKQSLPSKVTDDSALLCENIVNKSKNVDTKGNKSKQNYSGTNVSTTCNIDNGKISLPTITDVDKSNVSSIKEDVIIPAAEGKRRSSRIIQKSPKKLRSMDRKSNMDEVANKNVRGLKDNLTDIEEQLHGNFDSVIANQNEDGESSFVNNLENVSIPQNLDVVDNIDVKDVLKKRINSNRTENKWTADDDKAFCTSIDSMDLEAEHLKDMIQNKLSNYLSDLKCAKPNVERSISKKVNDDISNESNGDVLTDVRDDNSTEVHEDISTQDHDDDSKEVPEETSNEVYDDVLKEDDDDTSKECIIDTIEEGIVDTVKNDLLQTVSSNVDVTDNKIRDLSDDVNRKTEIAKIVTSNIFHLESSNNLEKIIPASVENDTVKPAEHNNCSSNSKKENTFSSDSIKAFKKSRSTDDMIEEIDIGGETTPVNDMYGCVVESLEKDVSSPSEPSQQTDVIYDDMIQEIDIDDGDTAAKNDVYVRVIEGLKKDISCPTKSIEQSDIIVVSSDESCSDLNVPNVTQIGGLKKKYTKSKANHQFDLVEVSDESCGEFTINNETSIDNLKQNNYLKTTIDQQTDLIEISDDSNTNDTSIVSDTNSAIPDSKSDVNLTAESTVLTLSGLSSTIGMANSNLMNTFTEGYKSKHHLETSINDFDDDDDDFQDETNTLKKEIDQIISQPESSGRDSDLYDDKEICFDDFIKFDKDVKRTASHNQPSDNVSLLGFDDSGSKTTKSSQFLSAGNYGLDNMNLDINSMPIVYGESDICFNPNQKSSKLATPVKVQKPIRRRGSRGRTPASQRNVPLSRVVTISSVDSTIPITKVPLKEKSVIRTPVWSRNLQNIGELRTTQQSLVLPITQSASPTNIITITDPMTGLPKNVLLSPEQPKLLVNKGKFASPNQRIGTARSDQNVNVIKRNIPIITPQNIESRSSTLRSVISTPVLSRTLITTDNRSQQNIFHQTQKLTTSEASNQNLMIQPPSTSPSKQILNKVGLVRNKSPQNKPVYIQVKDNVLQVSPQATESSFVNFTSQAIRSAPTIQIPQTVIQIKESPTKPSYRKVVSHHSPDSENIILLPSGESHLLSTNASCDLKFPVSSEINIDNNQEFSYLTIDGSQPLQDAATGQPIIIKSGDNLNNIYFDVNDPHTLVNIPYSAVADSEGICNTAKEDILAKALENTEVLNSDICTNEGIARTPNIFNVDTATKTVNLVLNQRPIMTTYEAPSYQPSTPDYNIVMSSDDNSDNDLV